MAFRNLPLQAEQQSCNGNAISVVSPCVEAPSVTDPAACKDPPIFRGGGGKNFAAVAPAQHSDCHSCSFPTSQNRYPHINHGGSGTYPA